MLDSVEQRTLVDFRTPGAVLVPGYGVLASVTFQGAVNNALQAFVDPTSASYKDVSSVISALAANYSVLSP
jgi:hypothetical protein